MSTFLYFNSNIQEKNQTPPKKKTDTENQTQKSDKKQNQKSIVLKTEPDQITTTTKTKNVKLVKESSKLITSTDEYEEYEVVKKYKVVIKKEQITTKPIPSNIVKKSNKPSNSKAGITANKTVKTLNPTSKKASK
ncbi:hypothetical protein ACQ9BO_04980 [Flavobacterium sp. P21]|uniref:hypothetical protein n=1 Tax=Flavobacterium sp. P21 TaxID=3423948 RepID=UPI003D673F9D